MEKVKEKAKDISKEKVATKVVAKEKPKAPLLTRSRIGVHGVSTTINELLYA